MQAEIITIGDEILIGQIVDTNSVYISKALNNIGIAVYQISSIQDDKQHILDALEEASSRADIVLITGGLGPTKDDITKHTLCEYFGDTLIKNDDVLEHIEALFKNYITTPISDLNRQQAMVPSKAIVLNNHFGTAPGMWLEKENTVFISMPGVPYEMKGLMKGEVIPRLQEKFERPSLYHKTLLTYGLGESAIAQKIEHWENELPDYMKLAYLPSYSRVRLRLSAKGTDFAYIKKQVNEKLKELYPLLGDIIQGVEGESSIETEIGRLLKAKSNTLALAESCTGGQIARQITEIAGASAYFNGGTVTYATASKVAILGVAEATIETHSVVSAQVAEEMAKNAKRVFKSDYAIATTGNAGPSKGDSDAEIGTVFIAIASPKKVEVKEFNFGQPREKVINKAVTKAFELLLQEILKN